MVRLVVPERVVAGEPIAFAYEADERVVGRVRLTKGTEALPFQLQRGEDPPSECASGHRVRGRRGSFRILSWGEHASGDELVLRFEGAKAWMTVVIR